MVFTLSGRRYPLFTRPDDKTPADCCHCERTARVWQDLCEQTHQGNFVKLQLSLCKGSLLYGDGRNAFS